MNIKVLFFLLCIPALGISQSRTLFRMVEIRTDSTVYNGNRHYIMSEDSKQMVFEYNNEDETAEIVLYPEHQNNVLELHPMASADFEVLDSFIFRNNAWHGKIRFRNLTKTQFLKIQFRYVTTAGQGYEIIPLLPCTNTTASIRPTNDDLFIGEEKVFELFTNNSANLRFTGEWYASTGMDYRLERVDNQVFLHVVPNEPGIQKLTVKLQTEKPYFDSKTGMAVNILKSLEYDFNVKTIKLKYLNIDRKDITIDDKSRTSGVEIQIDNNRFLELNKTYRVENQENPGGILIAEIFTRSPLSDNKVLCYLRTYNYHRSSEGYLYIKDGDNARFISNFNITPATTVTHISVMRDGSDWNSDLSVYPGETVNIKIEGSALYKAKFHFEDLIDLTSDTLIQNEQEVILRVKVPLEISKKRISLYNYASRTSYALMIKEFESPRPFDYVFLNYGESDKMLSSIHGPVLFDRTIRDIIITFDRNKIDSEGKLYGRQFLTVDLRVTGPNNELIDIKTLPNITVCPSDNSPRFNYYEKRNCNSGEISLNKFLRKNTSDLDDWSRINLSFKTTTGKYEGEIQEKEVEIILKKKTKFDIDVSFPAGLITVSKDPENTDKTTFSNLYGISMAMVAQLAFYHPEKIAKLRPYRFGAGFLALDAFNFQSERQDLALVVLASLYPTTRDKKLAFPLYIGGGYQFKSEKWMLLIGPGISVKL